ncbi:MAG: transposase [Candidatus Margulisbacteria bacterium]|nr:transposase [Candidatus Margulisiibacteriota bacterium]
MGRLARIKPAGQIYSVVTRVNNCNFAFADHAVCTAFLRHIKDIKKELGFKLYAFVIMSTHVHLLIEPDEAIADISEIMRRINGLFARKYNAFHKRKGHFWMQRFSSKLVEPGQYFANTIIYFALNPVKAGITDNPLKYEHSSIHNITSGRFADLLDTLPQIYVEHIENFLRRKNFVEILQKYKRILRQFSFQLRKTAYEQKFRYFIGSKQFYKQNILCCVQSC